MQIKITRSKDRRPLNRLLSRIQTLHNKSVSIGYFKDQRAHKQADMPYANLLFIHAFGLVDGAPVRDVMSNIKPFLGGGEQQSNFFKDLLKRYFKKGSRYTAQEFLSDIGQSYRDKGKAVFGNPNLLEVTNNPTPLLDTKELRDNFAYKTSITMKTVTR